MNCPISSRHRSIRRQNTIRHQMESWSTRLRHIRIPSSTTKVISRFSVVAASRPVPQLPILA